MAMTKIFRKKEWESLVIQRDSTTRINQGLINYLNEQEQINKKIMANKNVKRS